MSAGPRALWRPEGGSFLSLPAYSGPRGSWACGRIRPICLCLPVASPLCVCVSSCLLPEPPSSLAATRASMRAALSRLLFSPTSCPACSVHKSQRPCPAQTLMSNHGSSRTRALLAPQPQPSPIYTAPLPASAATHLIPLKLPPSRLGPEDAPVSQAQVLGERGGRSCGEIRSLAEPLTASGTTCSPRAYCGQNGLGLL